MKKITVYFENMNPVIVEDLDNTDLNEYITRLSELFHSETVNILTTTSGNMIIKSNKLNSILVEDKQKENVDPMITEEESDEEINISLTEDEEVDDTEIIATVE